MTEGDPANSSDRSQRVSLENPNRYPEVRLGRLRSWAEDLVGSVARERRGTLAVRLLGDRALRRLNREFRRRDAVTDVLSFPGTAGPGGPHLGDIAISVPAARRQAEAAGHSVERELKILLLHGTLHCLGYDHEADDGVMNRLEGRLRREWVAG